MSAAREALAGLCQLVEPGHPALHDAVARHGAVEVWQSLRAGRTSLGLSPELTAAAAARSALVDPGESLRRAEDCGARLVTPGDDEWPDHRLTWVAERLLEPPPLALWVRGRHPLDEAVETSVAVVGARAATSYGTYVAIELGRALAEAGWTVVSGGANGIDVEAHRGALLAQPAQPAQSAQPVQLALLAPPAPPARSAPTVAVLASGVDVAYPAATRHVQAQIAERGLLVSELAPGSHPTRRRFIVRNRLIAALSRGTVVVEAALRSGSLATAERARMLDRHVMAVPGSVTSGMSAGCHQQLRNGAICVTGAADVLETAGAVGAHLAAVHRGPEDVRDSLSTHVRQVLDAVPVRGGANVAVLARDAGVPVLLVQQVLPPLLAHGLVERTDLGWKLTQLGAGRP